MCYNIIYQFKIKYHLWVHIGEMAEGWSGLDLYVQFAPDIVVEFCRNLFLDCNPIGFIDIYIHKIARELGG